MLAAVLSGLGLYQMYQAEKPNNTVSFGTCNSDGKPHVFDTTSIVSLTPIKKGQKTTFRITGTILKQVHINKVKIKAKIGLFGKTMTEDVKEDTIVGPFTQDMPVDLAGTIKGTCKLTINYLDVNGKSVECSTMSFKIN
eukprot:TRINITY_DN11327_c0_g1_i2.p2 TRINITY_DN11327_c0_g1~~TRINITY_DN11327_c0_g1_i2.p2  ORF type:complete len:147 (+),score=27.37 TRINITY_DN11327_c0_g1_i2:25-441(+)